MRTIVLRSEDRQAVVRAKKVGAAVVVRDDWELVDEQVLFVAEGTPVPWNLVEAWFGFLERWEAAAPLWRYGVLQGGARGRDQGTAGETTSAEAREAGEVRDGGQDGACGDEAEGAVRADGGE